MTDQDCLILGQIELLKRNIFEPNYSLFNPHLVVSRTVFPIITKLLRKANDSVKMYELSEEVTHMKMCKSIPNDI